MEENNVNNEINESANFTKDFIMNNGEIIVDFFGDKREWYDKLKSGGSTYRKTSLDVVDGFDEDGLGVNDQDLPPLDVSRLTEERGVQIESFFKVYPEAKRAFLVYLKQNTKS